MPTGIYARHPLTEQTRRRISEALKGEKNWNWGKHKKFSEETKRKLSISLKGRKGSNLGKHFSKEWRMKISQAHKGSKSSSWKGGISSITELIRKNSKYKEWRQNIFIRDNFICQKCGEISGLLNAHHKYLFSKLIQEAIYYMPLLTKYDACLLYTPLWNLKNGITLCKDCHKQLKEGDKHKGKVLDED